MEAELKENGQIDRKEWDEFIQQSPQAGPYHLTAWMDIVAPGWKGIEVRENESLVAVMPLQIKKKGGFQISLQPPLTQYWGVCFSPDLPEKTYQHYSRTGKILRKILPEIPAGIRWFSYVFSPRFDYPLPFHWEGYQLHHRISYLLDASHDRETLMQGMAANTRYEIRKVADWEGEISQRETLSDLMNLIDMNQAAGTPVMSPAETQLLEKVWKAFSPKGMALHFSGRDAGGTPKAAALFIRFRNRVIYLAGAQDPGDKVTGLMAALVWGGILLASENNGVFDFEGSMMKGVESFFRGFGARPVSLLHIQKNELPLLVRWLKKSL